MANSHSVKAKSKIIKSMGGLESSTQTVRASMESVRMGNIIKDLERCFRRAS
jgi:hypothetical protein